MQREPCSPEGVRPWPVSPRPFPISPGGFNTASPSVAAEVVDADGKSLTNTVGELAIRRPFVGMTQSFWRDDERYLDAYWNTVPGIWMHGDLALRRDDAIRFSAGAGVPES